MTKKIIHIKSASVVENRIIWTLTIDDNPEVVEYILSDKILPFAVVNRVDSLLMGLMIFMIRLGYNLKSDIPVSESLYYNLTRHFLSAICETEDKIPKISCDVAPDLNKIGKIVSTGVSCGVDSLYTISTHIPPMCGQEFCLTDLTFLDAGSHHDRFIQRNTIEGRRDNCLHFATSIGLDVIEVDTNLPKLFDKYCDGGYSHIENHTFMTVSCMLSIQTGISKYYYSSGHSYKEFNCHYSPSGNYDSSYYDLLTLNTASYAGHRFYSTGGDKSRLEKVKAISDYKPAFNHLNVCVNTAKNDNTCFKCHRTILELEAVGVLDNFRAVFDVDAFRRNKRQYLQILYIEALKGDSMMQELMPYFKKELTIGLKIEAIIKKIATVFNNRVIARLK